MPSGPPVPGGYVPAAAPPGGRPQGVTPAGVALIITGAVSFVCALIWILAGLSDLHDEINAPGFDSSAAFAYTVVLSPVISVFLAPATITGGMQLIRGRSRGLVMVGVIAAIVPLSSCCFLAGIPVGIWALIVLRRPEVRDWFARGGGGGRVQQPAPYYQPWG